MQSFPWAYVCTTFLLFHHFVSFFIMSSGVDTQMVLYFLVSSYIFGVHRDDQSVISLSCVSSCIIVSFYILSSLCIYHFVFTILDPHLDQDCQILSLFLDEASTILDMSGSQSQNNLVGPSYYSLWHFIFHSCVFVFILIPLYPTHVKNPSMIFSHIYLCHQSQYMIHGLLVMTQPLGSQLKYWVTLRSFPWD